MYIHMYAQFGLVGLGFIYIYIYIFKYMRRWGSRPDQTRQDQTPTRKRRMASPLGARWKGEGASPMPDMYAYNFLRIIAQPEVTLKGS